MPFLDASFERGGQILVVRACVHDGWERKFYAQEFIDFKGDIKLRVAVWIFACGVSDCIPSEFPLDLNEQIDVANILATVRAGKLIARLTLCRELPWIITSNKKPAIDWEATFGTQSDGVFYALRIMVVFNLPRKPPGGTREWDLLPFFPGGQIESNRRRH